MANYIKNKELREEIIVCLEADELTPKAIDMFYLLVTHFGWNLKYKNPEDRKDCESQAMMDLYMYWRNYNPKYPNAFAYFTQLTKNGFAKGWRTIHPHKEIHISLSHGTIHSI